MVWLSTWPSNGKPVYAQHTTEAAAEEHAAQMVRAGAVGATAFWCPDGAGDA